MDGGEPPDGVAGVDGDDDALSVDVDADGGGEALVDHVLGDGEQRHWRLTLDRAVTHVRRSLRLWRPPGLAVGSGPGASCCAGQEEAVTGVTTGAVRAGVLLLAGAAASRKATRVR